MNEGKSNIVAEIIVTIFGAIWAMLKAMAREIFRA